MEAISAFIYGLGLGPWQTAGIAILIVVSVLAIWSPIWYPALVAYRSRATLHHPAMFAVFASAVILGAYLLVLIGAVAPVLAFVTFVVPFFKEAGYFKDSLFLSVVDFIYSWYWVATPFVSALVSYVVVKLMRDRWSRVVEALRMA